MGCWMRDHAHVRVWCRISIRFGVRFRLRSTARVTVSVRVQEALGAETQAVQWSPWRVFIDVHSPLCGEVCSHFWTTPARGGLPFAHGPHRISLGAVHTCACLSLLAEECSHMHKTPAPRGRVFPHEHNPHQRGRAFMHAPYPLPQEAVQACALPPPHWCMFTHAHSSPQWGKAFAHVPPSPRQGRVFRHEQNYHLSQGGRWRMRPAPLSTGGASGFLLAPCQHVSQSPMHSATPQGESTDVTIECDVSWMVLFTFTAEETRIS